MRGSVFAKKTPREVIARDVGVVLLLFFSLNHMRAGNVTTLQDQGKRGGKRDNGTDTDCDWRAELLAQSAHQETPDGRRAAKHEHINTHDTTANVIVNAVLNGRINDGKLADEPHARKKRRNIAISNRAVNENKRSAAPSRQLPPMIKGAGPFRFKKTETRTTEMSAPRPIAV